MQPGPRRAVGAHGWEDGQTATWQPGEGWRWLSQSDKGAAGGC